MAKTKHIQKRMSQRGIKSEMLDIVAKYGAWNGDKCILTRKACMDLLTELADLKKKIAKASERGGYVLVEQNGVQITTYAVDSYSRNKSRLH